MSKPKFSCVLALLIGVGGALLFWSCQQDRDTWGGAFVPEQEKLQIREAKTSLFETWTDTAAISSRTGISEARVGEIYDPVFGEKRLYLLTQLIPNALFWKNYDFSTITFDSVFFGFRTEEAYQDEPLLLTFSQLEKEMAVSDTAHKVPANKAVKVLKTTEVTPKTGNLVRIPLDNDWARDYLQAGKTHLSSYADWLKFSYGFRIDARRKSPSPNKGAMLKWSLSDRNTGIFFHWKYNDTARTVRLGLVSEKAKRFIGIERDYSGSSLHTSLTKSHTEQDAEKIVYVESAGDVRTVLDLTKVYEQWRDSLPVTVLRAELRIPLASANAPLSDTLINRLYTVVKNGGNYIASPDADRGRAVYDGYYNRQAKYYSLNLTYSIQALLQNQLPDNKLYLTGDTKNFGFGRAILNNGKATSDPMQLVITYTRH